MRPQKYPRNTTESAVSRNDPQRPQRRPMLPLEPRDWQTARLHEAFEHENDDDMSSDSDADWNQADLHPNERFVHARAPSDRDIDRTQVRYHEFARRSVNPDTWDYDSDLDAGDDSDVELPERPTWDDDVQDGQAYRIRDDDPIELMNCWTAAGQVRFNAKMDQKRLMKVLTRPKGTGFLQLPAEIFLEVAEHLDNGDYLNLCTALLVTIPRQQRYYRLAVFAAQFPRGPRSTTPHPDTRRTTAAALIAPNVVSARDTANAIIRTLFFRACGSDHNLWLVRKLVALYPLATLLPPPRMWCPRGTLQSSDACYAPHIPGNRRCICIVGAEFAPGLPVNPGYLHPVVGAVNMAVANDSLAILKFLLQLPLPPAPRPEPCTYFAAQAALWKIDIFYNPVHMAAAYARPEAMEILMQHPVRDMHREDPLVLAAYFQRRVGAHGEDRVRRCLQLLLSDGWERVADDHVEEVPGGVNYLLPPKPEFVELLVTCAPSVSAAERLVQTVLQRGYRFSRLKRDQLKNQLLGQKWQGLIDILNARATGKNNIRRGGFTPRLGLLPLPTHTHRPHQATTTTAPTGKPDKKQDDEIHASSRASILAPSTAEEEEQQFPRALIMSRQESFPRRAGGPSNLGGPSNFGGPSNLGSPSNFGGPSNLAGPQRILATPGQPGFKRLRGDSDDDADERPSAVSPAAGTEQTQRGKMARTGGERTAPIDLTRDDDGEGPIDLTRDEDGKDSYVEEVPVQRPTRPSPHILLDTFMGGVRGRKADSLARFKARLRDARFPSDGETRRLASINDGALTPRSSYVRTFFRWKVWHCFMRAKRGGDWGNCERAYDRLVVALPEYTNAWKAYAGILTTVLGLRFWLALAYKPPTLEVSWTLPTLRLYANHGAYSHGHPDY
ncbi:hypothetical protein FN846DRAFT_903867 [Sphaerosporella brunnea]|uniref:Uncharacterized protein n=1 Tax=Sphaerosporella brunnea TaxID=1250544 RepID=A0A5J5F6P1_9PEZI|nr:hypothetical protein FN846DRAFT_903867 [Sphaerosporella brunnea]